MKNPPRRPSLRHEQAAWADGFNAVAGLDEAGRGPLAGPVVAGAVLIHKDFLATVAPDFFRGLDDSKRMTPRSRDTFFAKLTAHGSIQFGIGQATVEEIDRLNILRATHLAMQRAIAPLESHVDLILVDGLPVPGLPLGSRAIVRGDAQSISIAAASVLAKVSRDRMMLQLDALYPQYGFARHKGYGTRAHLEALREHGPTPAHRASFQPVKQFLQER